MAAVELRGVSKVFADGTRAVRDLSLAAADGEFLVVVGPSGCGKSTVLRLIAGLDAPTGGEILFDGEPVDVLAPQERNVALVFQNYALYPHMNARQNLEFPLRMSNMPRDDIAARVARVADMLDLAELLERRPRELSGGQRQRVAMGRAIVRDPRVFLMDEPLSNLDAQLRVEIRSQIAALQRELGVTTVYVTHDQVEAMTLGHRVAVLRDGELQQLGTAREIYDRPANLFVAGFIGSPRMNLVHGTLVRDTDGRIAFDVAGHCLAIDAGRLATSDMEDRLGHPAILGLRPEAIRIEEHGFLPCRAIHVEALGHEHIVHLDSPWPMASAAGNEDVVPLTARLASGPPPDPDDVLSVAVDLSRCTLFEPENGAAL